MQCGAVWAEINVVTIPDTHYTDIRIKQPARCIYHGIVHGYQRQGVQENCIHITTVVLCVSESYQKGQLNVLTHLIRPLALLG